MRVNLIGNFQANTGLMQDAMILRGLITNAFGECSIRKVHYAMPQCSEAELNIFIEIINPALFSYAAKNIWIPNVEWTYRTWIPYLGMVDEVWVKTKEAETIFSELTPKTRYIGWTSIDKIFHKKKNYDKAIVLVGKNIYRNPKPILQAYLNIMQNHPFSVLPHLYIPYHPDHVKFFFPPQLADKVTLLDKEMIESEYDALLHECGLAICTSASEGFGHAVNEAMAAGCNLILSPIKPFLQLTEERATFVKPTKTIDHPSCLGSIIDISVQDLSDKLLLYVSRDSASKNRIAEKMRDIYEKHHAEFITRIQPILETFKTTEVYELSKTFPAETDLPDVSIVTITYNRRLFMPLAKYSYMIQSYPEQKLEWVIVDDGDDPIEDTLIGVPNVKYVRLDKKVSIGEKRNIGVQNAMYDTIVMMDDDDVYPNNSVLHRVVMMKDCAFCTTLPCYDIQNHISFMNVPPYTLPMAQRVSEASLVFKKSFWEARKFSDEQIAEGNAFIHGREEMCRELSPQEVIVSLVHSGNTSARKVTGEPNGCHYGFNEQLFAVVSEIGEALNTSCQKASACESDGGPPSQEHPQADQHHAS